ncbi:DUF6049 family protein [Actinokineospora sp. UTMC 2448]|uniref:DUF6049 family protein n=1 Tax=Actinokineospora sp. UTMC 2448 TaxID=2268449 RepID=UPI0021649C9E|nr:DUF6049 family protein [Actinokineospora sp. UTMC 2448]UVS82698.1 hypothetical protein Actkin_06472 [Actinokineospora sp. UTMC 2448]
MTARLRRGPAAVAAALATLAAIVFPVEASAQAQSSRLRVEIDTLSPRVVQASASTLTVTGTLTNTGDRAISEVDLRVQRGDVLGTETGLREAITDPSLTSALNRPAETSDFEEVTPRLERGASVDFHVTVDLVGDLGIDRPGVYPLALNLNGVPDFGTTERLGSLSTLLPVLSVPGGGRVEPPAKATPLTVVWPLVDEPRMVETALGGGSAVLVDDDLATSLAVGGRLYTLLDAVRTAAESDPAILRSLCFAVDPDLLATVSAMTEGYRVRSGDGFVDGRGATTADLWLTTLRELAQGQCVIALPYADADLAALSRADTTALQALAVDAPGITFDERGRPRTTTDVVESVLGATPVDGAVWPAGGTLDKRARAALAAIRPTTLLVDNTRLTGATGSAPFDLDPNLRAIPYDGLIAQSLEPRLRVADPAVATSSVQNGLAALVFRGGLAATPEPVLAVPPRRWAASAEDLADFLGTVRALSAQRFTTALALPALVAGEANGTASELEYTAQDAAQEIPAPVTARIGAADRVQRELIDRVLFEDDAKQVTPEALMAPLRRGLTRAASTAWRVDPEQARRAAAQVADGLETMLDQVSVNDPGRPLALASKDSPLPVYITNKLPVAVLAKINVGTTPGLRPQEDTLVRIPANAAIPRYLPTEVTRSGRFVVNVWLTTQSGTELGGTSRVELNSTSFGSIILIVTGTAAGALVLMVGLRVVRRLRKAKAADSAGADL